MAFGEGVPTPSTSKTHMFEGDTAGGDLAGTYPDPSLRDGSVTTAKIASGAVGTTELADGSVIATKLAPIDLLGIFPILSGSQIASGIITNAHIADGANISLSKLEDAGEKIVRKAGKTGKK